jgi:shikimate dehydrogenase
MAPAFLTGATRLVFILADPVGHVQAPLIYNPAFARAGLDWCLVPLGVKPVDLAATVAQLAKAGNLQGLNITIPHKAAARALCAHLGPEARRTQVVNTMRLGRDGAWAGESFDGAGFVGAAKAHGILHIDKPVVVVGAGGAGTAIAFALAGEGVRELHVVNREAARAEALLGELKRAYPDLEGTTRAESLGGADLAVNATSLGLHAGDAMPFDPERLPRDAALFDIIAARDTELMAACRARGLRVVGGRPMIEHQVAAQIAFWNNDAAAAEPGP